MMTPQVIGDKIPAGLPVVPSVRRLQRLSVTSSSSNSTTAPDKPVLRKHGKLIAFFRYSSYFDGKNVSYQSLIKLQDKPLII